MHHDPTFEAACRMEAHEKRCAACVRRREVINGIFICGVGKQYPRCKREKNGYQYDTGED